MIRSRILHMFAPRFPLLAALVAFAMIFSATLARAEEPPAVSATDGWAVHWGDPPGFLEGRPDWTTAAWAPVEALHSVTAPAGSSPIGWMRIPIPAGTWSDPGIFFGQLTGAWEAYWQGRQLSAWGRIQPDGGGAVGGPAWALIPLPHEAVGDSILIRFRGVGIPKFWFLRGVLVGDRTMLFQRMLRNGVAPFTIACGLLAAGLAALLHGLWLRKRASLALGAFGLSAGVLLLAICDYAVLAFGNPTLPFILMVPQAVFMPAATLFAVTELIVDTRPPWIAQVQRGLWLAGIGCTAVSVISFQAAVLALGLAIPVSLVVLGLIVWLAGKAASRGQIEGRVFGIGAVVMAITNALEFPPMFDLGSGIPSVHWGLLAVATSIGVIVVVKYRRVSIDLEQQTRQLESRREESAVQLQRLQGEALELLEAVRKLRETSEKQTGGISMQSTAIQETHVTAEEIRRTSATAAEKASKLLESAAVADEAARAGETALESSQKAIEAIRTEVQEIARTVDALEPLTRRIGGIVETVKELASRSNILALNASIEAAREVDDVTGLADVAREVRRLADQSVEATTRIRSLLERVDERVRAARTAVASGGTRVGASVEQVGRSAAHLRQLANMVKETSASVRQISAAVTQQNAGVTQIFATIEDLTAQTQETYEQIRETNEVAGAVLRVAEEMRSVETLNG